MVISIRPTEDCGIELCLTPPSLHASIRSDETAQQPLLLYTYFSRVITRNNCTLTEESLGTRLVHNARYNVVRKIN